MAWRTPSYCSDHVDPSLRATISLGEDYSEIREAIRAICADFPGEYWRELDARDGYPEEFVNVLAAQGYLAVLIPEEFGGSGLTMRAAGVILEECHAGGCYAAACHAQMYTDGDAAPPRQPGAEARHTCRGSRAASCGCRPSA